MDVSQSACANDPCPNPKTLHGGNEHTLEVLDGLRNHEEADDEKYVPDVILDWRVLCDDETTLSDAGTFETGSFHLNRFSRDSYRSRGSRSSSNGSSAIDGHSPIRIWIEIRSLFPDITFEGFRQIYEECATTGSYNIIDVIAQRILDFQDSLYEDGPVEPIPEGSVECGCCFTEYQVEQTTRCASVTSPHRFCLDCARRYAEVEIGNRKTLLRCIHESGCSKPFPESEIRRFLDKKTYDCLDKLRTENELRQANLEGLVYCPFCDFAAIMEDPTDRIFECQNPECGELSCRYCRVKSHHPFSCEQYQKDKKIDAKHAVEEAMTAALIKVCNNCKRPFLKEDGCNKMTCLCGNLQCYICSENVTGYDHFGKSIGKCALYDDTAERQRREVAAAQGTAVQNVLLKRNDVTIEDLTVDKDLLGMDGLYGDGDDLKNVDNVVEPLNDANQQANVRERKALRRRALMPLPRQRHNEQAEQGAGAVVIGNPPALLPPRPILLPPRPILLPVRQRIHPGAEQIVGAYERRLERGEVVGAFRGVQRREEPGYIEVRERAELARQRAIQDELANEEFQQYRRYVEVMRG